jgi:hypothetical protein
MQQITYNRHPDNTKQIEEFVGGFWVCDKCGGYGEYEGEYGPIGCGLCNSRLLPFVDRYGKVVTADWGDVIVKDETGLWLDQKHLN